VSNPTTAVWITGRGEAAIYAHQVIRHRLHLSGQLSLPEVFGDLEEAQRLPPILYFFTDVPCQLHPYLSKYDPTVLKIVKLALGRVHAFAHRCQWVFKDGPGFDARRLQGAGRTTGEMSEVLFSRIGKGGTIWKYLTMTNCTCDWGEH